MNNARERVTQNSLTQNPKPKTQNSTPPNPQPTVDPPSAKTHARTTILRSQRKEHASPI